MGGPPRQTPHHHDPGGGTQHIQSQQVTLTEETRRFYAFLQSQRSPAVCREDQREIETSTHRQHMQQLARGRAPHFEQVIRDRCDDRAVTAVPGHHRRHQLGLVLAIHNSTPVTQSYVKNTYPRDKQTHTPICSNTDNYRQHRLTLVVWWLCPE